MDNVKYSKDDILLIYHPNTKNKVEVIIRDIFYFGTSILYVFSLKENDTTFSPQKYTHKNIDVIKKLN